MTRQITKSIILVHTLRAMPAVLMNNGDMMDIKTSLTADLFWTVPQKVLLRTPLQGKEIFWAQEGASASGYRCTRHSLGCRQTLRQVLQGILLWFVLGFMIMIPLLLVPLGSFTVDLSSSILPYDVVNFGLFLFDSYECVFCQVSICRRADTRVLRPTMHDAPHLD